MRHALRRVDASMSWQGKRSSSTKSRILIGNMGVVYGRGAFVHVLSDIQVLSSPTGYEYEYEHECEMCHAHSYSCFSLSTVVLT